MINLQSTQTFESKVAPGVSFTLRRLSKMHVAKRDNAIREQRNEYRFACMRAVELLQKAGYQISADGTYQRTSEEPIAPEVDAEIARLDDEILTLLRAHIVPAALQASLLSIDGVTADGVPVTNADTLLTAGPECDELVEEIYRCSELANQVTAEEKQLLQSAA